MKVLVSITQIANGREYKGKITVNDVVFTYTLVFGVPIDEIENQPPPPEGQAECLLYVKNLYRITLKKNDDTIEQEDNLLIFLLRLVVGLAIEFYANPQTQEHNKEAVGELPSRLYAEANAFGATIEIGMEIVLDIPEKDVPLQLLRIA